MFSKLSNNYDKVCEEFEDMISTEDVLRGIFAMGFEIPVNIQKTMILPFLERRDIIVHEKSGTGKTAGFCIPSLEHLMRGGNITKVRKPKVLIISPVRELSNQTFQVLTSLGKFCDGLKVTECVGGTSVRDNINALRDGCQIVCGTPGRILDMIGKGFLSPKDLDIIILDEADDLLKRNFKFSIYEIFEACSDDVQICLYSATMPKEVIEIAENFLRDPVVSLLEEDNLTLDGIQQYYVDCCESQWKLDTLLDLYSVLNNSKAFIFVNKNERALELCENLRKRKFTPSVIMGTMMQNERNSVLREFRDDKTNILISSDLLARGIDIQGVDLVINYDFPTDRENYIHRIGRSGRHGRKGVAINFITKEDYKLVEEYEKYYHTKINNLPCDVDSLFD